MVIDIRTLILVLGLTHLIQFGVLLHQYRVNRTIRGLGWWLLWSGAEAAAFGCMFLRQIPALQSAAIMAQNGLLILGWLAFYIGILRFFGRQEHLRLLFSSYAVVLLAIGFFLFGYDSFNTRGMLVGAALAILSFLAARVLWANRTRANATPAGFLAVVCLAHGGYFACRAGVQYTVSPPADFFAPTPFVWTAFVESIVVGLLWTFGTILLVNQRLNSEMREATEEMELVFSTSPDAALITRLSDGLIVKVNEGFVGLCGLRREECVGNTTRALNLWKTPADREAVVAELRKTGQCRNYETVFRRKDGTELFGLLSAVVCTLQGIPHVISITRDITERRRAEEAIRLSEQRLQAYLSNAGDAIYVLEEATGRIQDCNARACHDLGYRRDELLKLSAPDIEAVLPAQEEIAAVHQQLQSGKARTLEGAHRRKDGTVFPVEIRLSSLAPGQPGLLLAIVRDITARKQAEERLRQERLFTDRLLNAPRDTVFLFDPATGKPIRWNDRFEQVSGYRPDEIAAMKAPDGFYDAEELAKNNDILGRIFTQGQGRCELTLLTKAGARIPFEYVATTVSTAEGKSLLLSIGRDLTERKRAEEALATETLRRRTLFEQSPAGIVILDPQTRKFVEFNTMAHQQLGYSREEFAQLTLADVEAAQTAADIQQVIADGLQHQSAEFETRHRTRQGEIRDIHVLSRVVEVQGRRFFQSIWHDITERKRAEQAARESENRFTMLADAAPVLIWESGPDKLCSYFNKVWLDFTGRTLAQELGNGWAEGVHPEDLARCLEIYVGSVDARQEFRMEYRLRRHDGEYRWILDHGVPRYQPDGHFAGYIGSCIDLTERRQADERLRNREAQMGAMMDAILESLLLLSPDGTILLANATAATRLGVAPEDFPGRNIFEILPPAVAARRRAVAAQVAQTGQPVRFEDERLGRWIDNQVHPVFAANGQVTGLVAFGRDITERKQAEEALKESEQRLQYVLQGSRLGFWDWNLVTNEVKRNECWAEMLGYRLDETEFTVKQWIDFVHPEDRARAWQSIQDHLEGRTEAHWLEYRMRMKGGDYKWILDQAQVVQRDANQRALRMSGTHTDISARKQAEAALQQSQRLLAQTEQLGQVGGWEIDVATQKVVWTEMARQIHELPPDYQPVVTEASRYFAPAAWPVIAQAMQRVIEHGEPFDLELEIITAKGNRRWVHNVGELDRARGKVFGFFQDITERKQAAAALERSQQILRSTFASLRDAFFILDSETGRITHCNRAAAEMFGYAVDAMLGRTTEFLHVNAATLAEFRQRLLAAMDDQGSLFLPEFAMKRQDGTVFPTEHSVTAIEVEGRRVGWSSIVRDITSRKQAEAALRASLDEKTTLLKEVHHRVKNNLQLVASLLNLQADRVKNAEVLELLAVTRSRVNSMALLHEHLYHAENLAHLDLAQYVDSLCSHLLRAAGPLNARVRLVQRVGPGQLSLGLDQAVPFGLLLNELVTNALKHAFPGERAGLIRVALELVPPQELLLTVADDGIGLPATLDPPQTPSLGLKLVFLLTQQLHGTVNFERELGTAVQVRCPYPGGKES